MKKVQEQQELLEQIDGAVGRRLAAKQMLRVAKRTAIAAQAPVGRLIQKFRATRAGQVVRESIIRDLEEFDRELQKFDTPETDCPVEGLPAFGSRDGSRPEESAPKRKRERVRVDWNRYIPGARHSGDSASAS